jgi:integrase
VARVKGVYRREGTKKYWLRYADAHSQIIRESSGTSDYKAALKELAKRRGEVAEGKEVERRRVHKVYLKDVMDDYLQFVRNQRAFKNKEYIGRELLSRFGNIPLQRFGVSLLESYQQELIAEGKGPATVNRKMAMLKHLVRKANDWKMVGEGTLRTIRKVKQLKEPPGRLRYLTGQEVQRLLAACKSHIRPIVIVALNTGMRRGEILKLKWDDVDLRNGLLLVKDTKNSESRAVPINAAVREVLAGIVRRLDSPYIFRNPKGQPYKEVKHAFGSACRKAGIRDFRFHDLRHSAASFMAMGGVSLLAIGTILGHKTASMTKRYSHLSPEYLQSAVAVIDREINQTSGLLTQFSDTVDKNSHPADPSAGVTARN